MAGRLNVTTGALPSTYGVVGAWGAQGSSKNYRRPLGKHVGRVHNEARKHVNEARFANPCVCIHTEKHTYIHTLSPSPRSCARSSPPLRPVGGLYGQCKGAYIRM